MEYALSSIGLIKEFNILTQHDLKLKRIRFYIDHLKLASIHCILTQSFEGVYELAYHTCCLLLHLHIDPSIIHDTRDILYKPIALSSKHLIVMDNKGLIIQGENLKGQLPYYKRNFCGTALLIDELNIEDIINVYCTNNMTILLMSDNTLSMYHSRIEDNQYVRLNSIYKPKDSGIIIDVGFCIIKGVKRIIVHTTTGLFFFKMEEPTILTSKIESKDLILHFSCDEDHFLILTRYGLFGFGFDDSNVSNSIRLINLNTQSIIPLYELTLLPFDVSEIQKIFCFNSGAYIITTNGQLYVSSNIASETYTINKINDLFTFQYATITHHHKVIDIFAHQPSYVNDVIKILTSKGLYTISDQHQLKEISKPVKTLYKGYNGDGFIIQYHDESFKSYHKLFFPILDYYVNEESSKIIMFLPIIILVVLILIMITSYFKDSIGFTYISFGLTMLCIICSANFYKAVWF